MFLACQVSETRSEINGCRWRCKSNQCCVAFWHVIVLWDFVRAKSNLSFAFAEKRLSTRSEQHASLWCTCNPVASSLKKGVSLLARWLNAKKARTSGCVRQENDMHLTTEICGLPAIQGHAWTVTSHGIWAHEEKGEPGKLMEAKWKSRSHAFQSLPSELSVWTPAQPALRVRFLRECFRCYPAESGHHSSKSTWCDLSHLVSQAEYGSSVNMDHPCLVVQQEVIGNGQMSWKLNLHRPTSQICQTLPVPGTRLLSFDPLPPPPLSLSLSLSLGLSLSLSLSLSWL